MAARTCRRHAGQGDASGRFVIGEGERIAIIAMDDQGIANIKRGPRPRDVHAEFVDKLAGANATTSSKQQRAVAFRAAPTRERQVMAAGNAFVSAAATPGYDASEIDQQAPAVPADKTIVMNKSGAPERPQAGGGNTGQEP